MGRERGEISGSGKGQERVAEMIKVQFQVYENVIMKPIAMHN